MRNNLPDARGFSVRSLLLVAFCITLAFGLANAAQQGNANNSNAGTTANANNSNAAAPGTPPGNKNAGQGNKNSVGGNLNANSNSANSNTGSAGGNQNTVNANQNSNARGAASPTAFEEKGCAQTQQQLPSQIKQDAKLSDLEVVDVTRADTDNPKERNRAGLYNTICVQVNNLVGWMNDKNNDPHNFFLVLNTYPLKAVRARPESSDSNFLRFDLDRTADQDTQVEWRNLLSRPKLFLPESRHVLVSLIYNPDKTKSDGIPIKSSITDFPLVDVNPTAFGWFAAIVAAAVVLFLWLARRSNLLRESGPQPAGEDRKKRPNEKPFSLGRTQMAFWFFIIITCYFFIWMVTSNGNTITNTVLGLMGISAATALGSVMITKSKSDETDEQRAALQAERQDLDTRIAALESKLTPDEAKELAAKSELLKGVVLGVGGPADAENQKLAARVAKLQAKAPPAATSAEMAELADKKRRRDHIDQLLAGASRGFFTDILSDADGISFHRFQIVAWTFALGVIFLAQVFNYLLMPDFDSTLLALLGISSGTYLGFKFPEKQA